VIKSDADFVESECSTVKRAAGRETTEVMMIELACSKCGSILNVPDHLAGKRGKCQQCGAANNIPAAPTMDTAPQPIATVAPESNPTTTTPNAVVSAITKIESSPVATIVFAVLKWVAVGIGGIFLLATFGETESAPRQAVSAALACFFGILARLMQAEQQFMRPPSQSK
jgi:hypothetical protein